MFGDPVGAGTKSGGAMGSSWLGSSRPCRVGRRSCVYARVWRWRLEPGLHNSAASKPTGYRRYLAGIFPNLLILQGIQVSQYLKSYSPSESRKEETPSQENVGYRDTAAFTKA